MNKSTKKIISILFFIFIFIFNTGCNQQKEEEYKLTIDEVTITIPEDFKTNEEKNEIISFLSNDNLNKIDIEKIIDETYTIDSEVQKIKDIYKNKNIELTEVLVKKDLPKIIGLVGIDKDTTIHIYIIENGNTKIKMNCQGNNSSSALVFRNIVKMITIKK